MEYEKTKNSDGEWNISWSELRDDLTYTMGFTIYTDLFVRIIFPLIVLIATNTA